LNCLYFWMVKSYIQRILLFVRLEIFQNVGLFSPNLPVSLQWLYWFSDHHIWSYIWCLCLFWTESSISTNYFLMATSTVRSKGAGLFIRRFFRLQWIVFLSNRLPYLAHPPFISMPMTLFMSKFTFYVTFYAKSEERFRWSIA
jgi:hypothetical protein